MTPARDPKQSFFVNPFEESWKRNQSRGIIEGDSLEERWWRRDPWGGIIEKRIIEKKSFREEASERYLDGIWEASEGIWEASGRHLGGIWEASGTPGGHGAPGGSKSQKSMSLSAKMQKFL
jgi:hypothetical protein